ncbi:hypothetical protein F4861DRAFT_542363 [Xylaria intraflava]|nr:hypothetical protein F4861DRAFT_542363 [Xylaria intraflava]
MTLPLSLHHDEDRSILILTDSDSEDDDLSTQSAPVESKRSMDTMRQNTKEPATNVPTHPIPAMQPAFSESLMEATNSTGDLKPKLRFGDAKQRRTRLLDGAKGSALYADLWRYRPGQEHHELWKLLAQVSFGVYLLLNGIANSNEQVVDILQRHIDEVDEFLETTLEDVNMAIQDVSERIDYLKLPMENMDAFEDMLEDRDFRLQIITENEKISHIAERTTLALEATFRDVDQGLEAVREFAAYLDDQRARPWRQQRPELADIYDAMKGNAQGWYQALNDILAKAKSLEVIIANLTRIVAEMDQKAGEVSRRMKFSVTPFSGPAETSLSNGHSRSTSSSSAPQSPRQTAPQLYVPGSPAEKEVVFFEEKEVAFVHPVSSTTDLVKPALQVPDSDEGVYLLQPRTYTPRSPEPLAPSVMGQQPASQAPMFQGSQSMVTPKQTSLRQRVSMKGGNLPEVIHVPSHHPHEMGPSTFPSSQYQLSPMTYQGSFAPQKYQSALSPPTYQTGGSEYVSSLEVRQSNDSEDAPGGTSAARILSTVSSPRSEKPQYFYPVRASPHSPLQQRPHTSATARPHMSHVPPVREQRSAMGMSVLTNTTNGEGQNGKRLKKKKSAFGWLKKAFTLDDDERQDFQARKQQQTANPYYEARSPKFLDGKRLPPDPRRDFGSIRSISRI